MCKSGIIGKPLRSVENGRLVYYRRKADSQYWDEHWSQVIKPGYYETASRGGLGNLEAILTHYLPKKKRIIEAGCGAGHLVLALRQHGYNIEGVDWGRRTVETINRLFPELPVRQENVCALEVTDEYYGGYISIGVIEHRHDGPEPFLLEAFRVLEKGGIAIFTVPWFNPLRRIKGWMGYFRTVNCNDSIFYQYAYKAAEIKRYLKQAGFSVLETQSTKNTKMGFDDELPWLQNIYRQRLAGRLLKRIVNKILRGFPFFGHSQVYVCKKNTTL